MKANGYFVQSSSSFLPRPWWWLVLCYPLLASSDFSYEAIRVLDPKISEDLISSAMLVDEPQTVQAKE